MTNRMTEFWEQRTARERQTLAAGLLIGVAAVAYAGIWRPLGHARASLRASLPRLEKGAAQIDRAAAAIRPAAGGNASVTAALAALGITAAPLPASAGQQGVRVGAIDFDKWLKLLPAIERRTGLTLARCDVTPAGSAGQVQVKAVFAAEGGA